MKHIRKSACRPGDCNQRLLTRETGQKPVYTSLAKSLELSKKQTVLWSSTLFLELFFYLIPILDQPYKMLYSKTPNFSLSAWTTQLQNQAPSQEGAKTKFKINLGNLGTCRTGQITSKSLHVTFWIWMFKSRIWSEAWLLVFSSTVTWKSSCVNTG